MTALQEASLVAGREIRRNLRSAKGVVLLALCLLGGVAASLAMNWLSTLPGKILASRMGPGRPPVQVPAEDVKAMTEALLSARYGESMGQYLAQAPFVLFAAALIAVWLAPMLTALVSFDAISTDLQHRGIRYYTLRVRRASYYFGKLLGLWAVVSLMMFVSQAVIWIAAIAKGAATAGEVASWGPRFWLVSIIVAAAWSGLAQLVSSQFKVPILALLVTLASFCGLWIIDVIGELSEKLRPLVYSYPSTYDEWLLSPDAKRIALGCLICLGFMIVSSGGGMFLFRKRDL